MFSILSCSVSITNFLSSYSLFTSYLLIFGHGFVFKDNAWISWFKPFAIYFIIFAASPVPLIFQCSQLEWNSASIQLVNFDEYIQPLLRSPTDLSIRKSLCPHNCAKRQNFSLNWIIDSSGFCALLCKRTFTFWWRIIVERSGIIGIGLLSLYLE